MSRSAIVFGAKWCGPCKVYKKNTVEPMIEDGYPIQLIDVDEDQEFAMKYRVRGIPTTIIFDDDVLYETFVGTKNVAELSKLLAC